MSCPICNGRIYVEAAPSDKPYRYDCIYCIDCTANFEPDVRDGDDLVFVDFDDHNAVVDRMRALAFGLAPRRNAA